MQSSDYLSAAATTESSQFHADKVSFVYVLDLFSRLQDIGDEFDQLKRTLYYGQPPSGRAIGAADHDRLSAAPYLDPQLLHAALGLVSESAEFLDAAFRRDIDKVHLLEEAGDLEWYLAIVYRFLGQVPEAAYAANIRKLTRRYPDKFTSQAALNRDLIAERQALEGECDVCTGDCAAANPPVMNCPAKG